MKKKKEIKIKPVSEWKGFSDEERLKKIFPNGYKTFVLKPNEKREKLGFKK